MDRKGSDEVYLAEGLTALAVLAAPTHHPPVVTVHSGDTLSQLAAEHCPSADYYPGLARASGIRNPDMIEPGERVTVVCSTTGPHSPATATLTSATGRRGTRGYSGRHRNSGGKTWGVTYGYPNYCGDGDGDGYDIPCSQLHHHAATTGYQARHARRATATSSGGSVTPGSSFEACVIARESGGNAQVMNSSQHYGLYQFSLSTWQAYGGSAADFGHASATEQRRIFLNAIAQGGQSNWSPYDGCLWFRGCRSDLYYRACPPSPG
jgi:hypothetical protein